MRNCTIKLIPHVRTKNHIMSHTPPQSPSGLDQSVARETCLYSYSNPLEDHLKSYNNHGRARQSIARILARARARARRPARASDAAPTTAPSVMGSSEKTPKKEKREKTPKKEKRDDDGEDDSDGNGGGALRPTAPIARPLADLKTTKKILKVVKKGA